MNRERLELSISQHEGYSTIPYRDTERLWTTGKGINLHTIRLAEFAGFETIGDLLNHITQPQVLEEWFQIRVDGAIQDAKRWLGFMWDDLTPARQEVLAEMAYQLGYTRLSKFVGLRAAIATPGAEDDVAEILDSLVAKKQAPARYQRLAEKYRTG